MMDAALEDVLVYFGLCGLNTMYDKTMREMQKYAKKHHG